jgi:DNA polymerase-1
MRKFFKAKDGCILLDADYSQIELRLMAHLSGDAAMQEAFRSGADIHTATAAKVFDMPEVLVTPEMRSAAKAVNFGILYGMGAFSLSKDIHVSQAKAKKYIADYLGSFPNVSTFLHDVVENGRANGYVCTMLGRRRYVPELNARNKVMQAAGERIAKNTPVQGTAADLIKLAMVHVHDRLAKEVPSAKLLLQVHDELIVEVPLADADAAAKVLHEEMLGVASLSVPLTADVNRGETWYDAKG